jgi:hypothetical protein
MIKGSTLGCQIEPKIVKGKPGTRRQAEKLQKYDRLPLSRQEKITINIRPKSQRPSETLDKRSEVEGACRYHPHGQAVLDIFVGHLLCFLTMVQGENGNYDVLPATTAEKNFLLFKRQFPIFFLYFLTEVLLPLEPGRNPDGPVLS